jgi:hypothetical protein
MFVTILFPFMVVERRNIKQLMLRAKMVICSRIWGETFQYLLRTGRSHFTSVFEEDPMFHIGEPKNVDPGSTACRHINACNPKAPPAPDPVKLDPNHFPLGGETTSIPA